MIINEPDNVRYIALGSIIKGVPAVSIAWTHEDMRKLLLLGAKRLNDYCCGTLFPLFIAETTHKDVLGLRAHLGEHYIDLTPGELTIPDKTVELEIGRFSFEWLCGLDNRHGEGSLAGVIREDFLPKMVKIG